MSNRIIKTRQDLAELAKTHDGIIVSYSTGKDSQILVDLCAKTFRRVVALHLYFVPGLDYIERGLEMARHRWGVEVVQLPHWNYIEAIKTNQYCNYRAADKDSLTDVRLLDLYKLAMQRTGLRLVATGARKSDGLWRRRWMANIRKTGAYEGVLFPMQDWLRIDITAYMKTHHIEVPPLSKIGAQDATGIGLNNEVLLWLHDTQPEDFARMRRVFPLIDAVIARRAIHGIGGRY